MSKSPIRTRIEKIVGTKNYGAYIDATSKKKTKYRLKLVMDEVPEACYTYIKKLPHVLDAKYFTTPGGWYNGVVIYFDCKPSEIK